MIGDIHGELTALETLMDRLPTLKARDTVVFLGDYVDRGPDSRGVIRYVQRFARESVAKVVTLRGNHEDIWIECHRSPNPGYLLPRGNGCVDMFRSFTDQTPLRQDEFPGEHDLVRLLDVGSWLPKTIVEWMSALPLWHEDEHGIYVHAGLESVAPHVGHVAAGNPASPPGNGAVTTEPGVNPNGHANGLASNPERDPRFGWKHPRDSSPKPLMWMREAQFYKTYKGKRVVFGHTQVKDLPSENLGPIASLFADPRDVWVRGDLIGIDTGAGKGGFLSAVELPAMRVYESR